ncbi:FAD-dependent monooxygenase [Streptomyces buecherae]|uniref:FAD-dependent monooxygenase n=1 Tax=Streptomyces buecherae TaxID=2763006 RepID=UPI003791C109
MRVACVGAGPGGLMLALLLRRLGDHEVDVFERSPADATFGFGVVFSRLSLARLRQAAPDVVAALLDQGARWEDVEVRRDGHAVRSSGHGFAAVERRALLLSLQKLARESGARLHYRTEADATDLLERYDVVVAADGAGSRTRAAQATEWGARQVTGESRYAWFGVERAFDAMTFLFADGGHGPVGAHVYPYTRDKSTFLVEISAETFRAGGFVDGHTQPPGWNDEQAMEYCAKVFAADLEGARLIGNGSRWLTFSHVDADRWSHGRLVGIGDAVHTAHFSVGSGTTMALEDATELARRLHDAAASGPDALEEALVAYEKARRPIVAGIQRAAWASRRMWEHQEDHADLDVGTLMLRLLSRSGQSPADLLLRLDKGLAERCGHAWTPKPTEPVPALVSAGEPAAPGDAVLVGAADQPLAPTRDADTVVVEVDPVSGPLEAFLSGATDRLRQARAAAPSARVGVLVRATAPAEEPVATAVARVAALVRAETVDVVAVAPGEGDAADNRAAQMALSERVRAVTGARTAYVCPPAELSQGWTHVQSARADLLWTTTA